MKEEPINRSFSRTDVTRAISAFEGALPRWFQNIEGKAKAFEALSTRGKSEKGFKKIKLPSRPARKSVPFIKILRVTWH